MNRYLLLCAFTASLACGQIPFPSHPAQPGYFPPPVLARSASAHAADRAAWTGPLAEFAGNHGYYRTFAIGSATPSNFDAPPGAVLAGFEISTVKAGLGEVISSLQPMYWQNRKTVMGTRFGELRGARTQLRARDGYAVRGIRAGEGGALTGFQVTFARIQLDGTLSNTDVYASGSLGNVAISIDAGDMPICGISVNATRMVDSIALLVSMRFVETTKPALTPVRKQPDPAVASLAPSGVPRLPPGASIPEPLKPGPAAPSSNTSPSAVTRLDPPATPAARTDAPPMLDDGIVADVMRNAGDSLVFVEGTEGNGSGFICRLYGKRVLITNQHVVQGNPRIRFTNLNQAQINTGAAKAAVAHDLLSYDVPDAIPALEPVLDFAQTVNVGDEVLVLGNTEGARVIKPLPGKVVGIGPNLVEISSEFMPGNSGSPIIHLKSKQVIGVATYALIRKVNSLTGKHESAVRRFGFRLDSVTNWQPIDWSAYQAEAAATKKAIEFSGAIIALFDDLHAGQFDPSRHTEARFRTALAELSGLTRRGTVRVDRIRMVQNFLGEVRNVVRRDVEDLRNKLRYDYFQREIADEAKFRDELYKGIGEAMRRLR